VSGSAAQEQLPFNEALMRADLAKLPAIAESVKTSQVWTCPTLVQVQMDAEQDSWANGRGYVPRDVVQRYEQGKLPPLDYSAEKRFTLALVGALHSKGAGLLLGTDTSRR